MHEAEVAEDAAGEDVQFISESEPEEDLECPPFEDLVQMIQKVRRLSKSIIRKPGRLDSLKSRGVWLEGGFGSNCLAAGIVHTPPHAKSGLVSDGFWAPL